MVSDRHLILIAAIEWNGPLPWSSCSRARVTAARTTGYDPPVDILSDTSEPRSPTTARTAHAPEVGNKVEIWVDSALDTVEFLRASYPDFAFPPHLHDTFAIGIIEQGAQRFSARRGQSELMPQGTLCAINPGEVHEGRAGDDGGWQYRMFYPSTELVGRALRDDLQQSISKDWALDAHVLKDDRLYAEYLALHDASRTAGDLLERESRTIVFLRHLFSRHAGLKATEKLQRLPRTVGIVKDLLHANFAQSISIEDLAFESRVSETQVIRSFSQEMGMAPHAYLVALRVEHAKRLILLGKPLAEIAADTGFTDQSHLNRHFKRYTGVTPGAFAKSTTAR